MIVKPPYEPNFPKFTSMDMLNNTCINKINEVVKTSKWDDISDLLGLLLLISLTDSSIPYIIGGKLERLGSKGYEVNSEPGLNPNATVCNFKDNDIYNSAPNNKGKSDEPIKCNISTSCNNRNKQNIYSCCLPRGITLSVGAPNRMVPSPEQTTDRSIRLVGNILERTGLANNECLHSSNCIKGFVQTNNKSFILDPDYFSNGVINLGILKAKHPITVNIPFNGIDLTVQLNYYDKLGNIFPRAQLVDKYPEYASLDDLRLYGRGNYPIEYLNSELAKVGSLDIIEQGEIEYYEDISYYSTPSLNRIRHFRISELYHLYTSSEFLQSLNIYDGNFNELEIMGTWLYFSFVDVPEMIKTFFSDQATSSRNGMELRARLKVLTVSMKRWLYFWEQKLERKNIYEFLEIETILGYIVSNEYTTGHENDLETTLQPSIINYIEGRNFLEDFKMILLSCWKKQKVTIKDISFNDYLNDYGLWATSGAASEIRVIGTDNKKYRVNKGAIPVVVTKKELYDYRVQPYRALLKSEVGKVRIAYSAPTYDSLLEGYILHKYSDLLVNVDNHDYVSFSNSKKLDFSIGVSELLGSNDFGSTDIEKNDFSHDTYLDMYSWFLLIQTYIQEQDKPLFLDLASRKVLNWVFVRKDLNGPHVDYKTKEGSYLLGRGGVMSGRRSTTFLNNVMNSTMNSLSGYLVSDFCGKQFRNYYGGDDSLCRCSYYSYWSRMVVNSKILLSINPVKSYVSNYNAEFFRVASKKDLRQGYLTRIVHSIVASNPVSKQEVDKKSKIKAMLSNIQMFVRRGANDNSYTLLDIYTNINKIPDEIKNIPTSSGGLGLFEPSKKKCSPGIPMFRDSNDPEDYKLQLEWYDELSFREGLPAHTIPDINKSYLMDMVGAIRNIDARNERKKKYKYIFKKWLDEYKLLDIHRPVLRYIKQLQLRMTEINNQTGELMFFDFKTRKAALDKLSSVKKNNPNIIINDFVIASDIINRYKARKVKEKIQTLISSGAVLISDTYINSRSAQLLLSEIIQTISSNGTKMTLSPDSTKYRKVGSFYTVGNRYLDYTSCTYLNYYMKLSLIHQTIQLVGSFERW
jgi:hypothetical protein